MFSLQQIFEVPVWEEGIFEYAGKVVYGMVYDEVCHHPCFQIRAYESSRKKGQTIDWSYKECSSTYDFVDKYAPHLYELLAFDGWLQGGIPVDYHANALYFYKRYRGWYRSGGKQIYTSKGAHWGLFCDLTLFDSSLSNGDEPLPIMDTEKELYALSNWLRKREPRLRGKFNQTMKQFGVEYMK